MTDAPTALPVLREIERGKLFDKILAVIHRTDGFASANGAANEILGLFNVALRHAQAADPHARDIADWCQRSLDDARKTGNIDTRPFVQNAERIIAALRLLAGHPQAPASGEAETPEVPYAFQRMKP